MSKSNLATLLALAISTAVAPSLARADAATANPKVASQQDGKYFDAAGNPTYKIAPNGQVDWYTFSGYRRFNGTCDFQKIVINGKQSVNTAESLVMPAFGDNKNVMCYLDDIYVYLRARADGGLGSGRPPSNEPKPKTAIANENDCMGP
jgi:hypothetical protein